METLKNLQGFYHHYKHDPSKGIADYAYEVLNIGHHTEIENFEESAMVVYRPLYESAKVYKEGKHWDVRPLNMFMEDVIKDGKTFPRFKKIIDNNIIEQLSKKRDEMYK